MEIICTIICLVCCGIVVYLTKHIIDFLKHIDDEQMRKLWECEIYEKDSKN